ncbi:hypothetical protein ACFWDQ_16610 [Streptomyces sp. NPDC060053]|uniref:hypothetical protein n=1 Tax=Streptomyces sp. NPDC060053 TaxID=3347047 RepID=UPI0036C25450
MTLAELIAQARTALDTAIATRQREQDALMALRSDENLTEDAVTAQVALRDTADAEVTRRQEALAGLEAEQVRENELAALQARTVPAANRAPAYDQVHRVGQDERTYRPDQDRRGRQFERDVVAAALGDDYEARDRLSRHMAEERVERGNQLERAAGTAAFAGLVVPQYLTDLYAPAAAAKRPFADACRKHDMPAQGMTVNLSRITTSTSTAIQTENAAVSETDIDDTLLTFNVQTNAGQQTLSRQAIERGAGVEPVVLDDLFRRYATTLDSTLLNQATNGLTNVATTVAYTDASPTAAEAYPKIIEGLAGVESALLDMASGDNIAVMHSRRWYWLQNAMGSTWPLITQPGIVAQTLGANYATAYGSGVRGVLPNGTPVIVDNNIATTLGGGTEDEIYLVDRQECHLWEDPSAPMYIRAEQTKAASLGVLMVVYGYFAYTHVRYAHARKIAGTGLIAPTFTGV